MINKLSSVFDNSEFRLKLAQEEKSFVTMYIRKAEQMMDKNQMILAVDDLEQALEHAKVARKHLEKTNLKQDSKEKQENSELEKMELI